MMSEDILGLAQRLNERGEPYALVTVVRVVAPSSAYVGAQAIVFADGTLHGWIGGGCAKDVVIGAARRAIESGEPKLVRLSNATVQPDDDIEQFAMSCASNGTIELFIQPYSVRTALCVLGDTPAASEARFLAERLRIRLTESPDEAPVVLIATQGQGDEDALERALNSKAANVLMIASRRKADRLRDVMRTRGLDDAALARLTAPAGPDAGAKTPGEIAMVAIVGVLAMLRGKAQTNAVSSSPASHALPDSEPRPVSSAAGKFINPVCGVEVDIAAPKHVERHEGTDYYFCCDSCWVTFRKDPAKYAAIHGRANSKATA